MAFLNSPGINVSEIDQTLGVRGSATGAGAFVGNFRWGPVGEITDVSSENELASIFATPSVTSSVDFHTASYFLRYASTLRVVREATSAAYNANAGGHATTLVKNRTHYDGLSLTFANVGLWVAKYPGVLGNSLRVSMFAYTDGSGVQSDFDAWAYKSFFNGPPGTSAWASARGALNDEVHVIVIDEDGLFTGTPGTVLEKFEYVSQALDALSADGSSNYLKNVINDRSKYIWFGAKDATNLTNLGNAATSGRDYATADADGVLSVSFTGGADSAALTSTEIARGWDLFEDPDTVDVSLLIAGNLPSGSETTVANDVISCAVGRKDAVAFISPGAAVITASAIKTFADALTQTSYAFIDSGRLKVYDKYNDQYINIPACSSVAGLAAATELSFGSWYSPAGESRGQLLGVTKLFYNPSKTDRDTLYKSSVNSIVTFPGVGTILFGDRTHLTRPTAFQDLGIRRLFITLQKSISSAARAMLFEFNDEFTRANFINLVEPFLRDVKGRRGLTSFRVVCDETNNTSQIVNANQFVGDIYVQPNRSINFIQLNFIATRNNVEFTETVN